VPEATYLAWADLSAYVPEGIAAAPFFARNAGVILEDASSFVADGGGHVRMNLAMPRSLLQKGLDRMAAAVSKT
jgi:cystathionine beta-lyase